MKASLCPISTQGAVLRRRASALTVPHFHDAVGDTDTILSVLISNGSLNAIFPGLVYLEVVWEVIWHVINRISVTGTSSSRLKQ